MGESNLLDKTNALIRRQNEVNSTLLELRDEVIKARDMNQKLAEENSFLRSRIRVLESKLNGEVEQKHETIKERVQVKEVQKPEPVQKPIPSQPVEVKREQAVPVMVHEEKKVLKDTSIERSSVYEFFLGKNVIAKIGGGLIALGVFAFGRIAYDWMNDLSRVLFILSLGIIFFGVGYFFEKRSSSVFASTFYTVGLAVMLISNYLAFYEYSLIVGNLFILMGIFLSGFMFIYFRVKISQFTDTSILILVGAITILSTNVVAQGGADLYMSLIQGIVTTGFMSYTLLFKYQKNRSKILPGYLFLTSGLTIFSLFLIYESNEFVYFPIFVVLMTMLGNFFLVNKVKHYNPFMAIQTTLTFLLCGISIASILDFEYYMNFILIAAGLLIPIYVYFYQDVQDEKVRIYDYYGVLMAGLIFVYLLYFDPSDIRYSTTLFTETIKNYYTLLGIIILYFATKLSVRKTHFIMLMLFAILFGVNVIQHLVINGAAATDYLYYISNIVVVVGLLFIDKYLFTSYKNKNLTITINVLAALGLMIYPLYHVYAVRNGLYPNYEKYFYAAIIYGLSVYKFGFINKFFDKDEHLRTFNVIVNGALAILVLLLDFIYFAHDFSNPNHLFIFFMVLIPNIYIIFNLRELYRFAKEESDYSDEWLFIFAFKFGVLIQSMFIHRYINFTYDKVILSSYFMIAAAIGVLYGFKERWKTARYIALGAIYFSLIKFFVYDFFAQDLSDVVQTVTYITLGVVLLGISFLYSRLEKTYGGNEILAEKNPTEE